MSNFGIKALICAMAGICLAVGLAGCDRLKGQAASAPTTASTPAPAAVPVLIGKASRRNVTVDVRTFGQAQTQVTVAVKSMVAGPIEKLAFREGQDVKKGQVLATVDPRPFEIAIDLAQANLARDTVNVNNAERQMRNAAELLKRGASTQDEADSTKAAYEALVAQVKADQASVANAKLQLSYCVIASPIDGRAGQVLIHEGNLVKVNDVAIVNIDQIRPIDVSFTVPQQRLAAIRAQMAQRELEVLVWAPQDQRNISRGQLTFIDSAVDMATGTIRLKASFANDDLRLWPGQFFNVILRLDQQDNAVIAPTSAIQNSQDGQFVYVVDARNVVHSQPVTVDREIDGETIVAKGLTGEEMLVTDGQLGLVNGSTIQVKAKLDLGSAKPPTVEGMPASHPGALPEPATQEHRP
jgi:membrane fusion protein, multidrug efflux system